MQLPDNSPFFRQTATIGEMKEDERAKRYISPYSRTRQWGKPQSDHFFERVKLSLWKKGVKLENVKPERV